MRLEINQISLRNFKGCTDRTIKFDGNTKVKGCNGSGKSTLADAWYWIFADCNTALIKNPPVTPLGANECESKVEIELTLDGKNLTVAKIQKYKTKEVDGKITSAVDNRYEINSVPKTQKAFIADLIERGIDMDNFLIFSHPMAFTMDSSKTGREKQREVLFKMCEGITDADIASDMDNINELKSLMETYRLDEIEQMNKATIKKIAEAMGKDNSIVNARIDELLSQKSTLDEKVLNEQKNNYEAEIERIEKKLDDLSSGKAEASEKLSKLKIERESLVVTANKELNDSKADYDKKYREAESTLNEHSWQLKQAKAEKERLDSDLAELNESLKKQRALYKAEQGAMLDDSDRYCPTCHREFEPDKLKKIKADFEKRKTERMKVIKASGDDINTKIKDLAAEIKGVDAKIDNYEKLVDSSTKQFESIKAQITMLPASVDMSADEDYVKVSEEILKLEEEMSKDDISLIDELKSQKNVNKQMLNQVIAELGTLSKNKDIDNRVAELKHERKQNEINKASAEKILDEVERFKKEKNNRLSNEINNHFKIAQFRLFKTLKNRTVEDACDVLIDGKEINTQANQSLQILARLDIINGLSDFFKTWLPVICDDFALFTSESEKRIELKNQLIKLIATDGINELIIEKED